MKLASLHLSLTCAILLLPSVASAQQCFGLSPTTGCRVNGGKPTLCLGTGGADHIIGTNGNDVIVALGGDDTVQGQKGSDVICGGEGSDRLRACSVRRTHPVFGAISCVLNTQSAAVNTVAGIPGPQRAYIAATAQLLP